MATYAWTVVSTSPEANGAHTNIDMNEWLSDAKQGYAAQVGTHWYRTLADALNEQDETAISLTLLNDAEEDVTIKSGQSVFLDLAGYTLTNRESDSITVEKGGTLFISDTSEGKTGVIDNVTHKKAALFNNGTVEIHGGTFTRSREASTSASDSNGNSYYTVVNHGKMTVYDGKVSCNGSYSSLIENGYYNYTATDARTGYAEGINDPQPQLTVLGGEFSGGLHLIKNDDGGNLLVRGGKFSSFVRSGIMNTNVAVLEGGLFSVGENEEAVTIYNCDYTAAPNLSALTIEGGTYDGAIRFGTSTIVRGGRFSIDVSAQLDEGYEQIKPSETQDVYIVKKTENA